jgi:hypothetical protein
MYTLIICTSVIVKWLYFYFCLAALALYLSIASIVYAIAIITIIAIIMVACIYSHSCLIRIHVTHHIEACPCAPAL